jgi:hypothetical protein
VPHTTSYSKKYAQKSYLLQNKKEATWPNASWAFPILSTKNQKSQLLEKVKDLETIPMPHQKGSLCWVPTNGRKDNRQNRPPTGIEYPKALNS